MNLSKSMMLLLGRERGFDLHAGCPAARALQRRGLTRTYDITPGRDDNLPDKNGTGSSWGTRQGPPRPGSAPSPKQEPQQTPSKHALSHTAARAGSTSRRAS